MSLFEQSATQLLEALNRGSLSSTELTRACLDRITQYDAQVGAFLRVHADRALEQAGQIDRRRAAGEPLGRLAGLPVAVKDILCSTSEPTTCASRMLERFVSPYDATVIRKLKQADAVLIGRTNMDEFAMGGSTENSAFQITRNPWDLDRTPGGSSGGAAACIAARMVPLSVGSDTGGSIRQPAAFCNVVGMKPTYGRVSRYGLVAFASSLDQVGPLAGSAEDAALLLEVLSGHDPLDSTSAEVEVPPYHQLVSRPLEGLRIALVPEHFEEGLDDQVANAVRQAVQVYQSLGATVREVSLPHAKYAIATYYLIAPSEASSNLARYDGVHFGYRCDEQQMLAELQQQRQQLEAGEDAAALEQLDSPLVRMYRQTRAEGFGPEVKRRILLGTFALSAGYYDAYYLKAQKVRRLICEDYAEAFKEVDVIAGPVTPAAAFRLGEKVDDPLAMYMQDMYTVSMNLTGMPGISIPCGQTRDGLPIGLQLQAPPLEEERLLRAAWMFQQHTDWHRRQPPLATSPQIS